MDTEKMDYSKTVFLPKTSFSMKAGLVQKEPQIQKMWEDLDLYHKILEFRKNAEPWLLHDGPPYANGHIHIGHALNKILKDMLVKSWSLMGYRSEYVPGWDCHGLPIEQQLLKDLKISKRHVDDIVDFREKARAFASKFIDIQRSEFKRLGVLGEWEKPYITMADDYEAAVTKAFIELFEKGYIQRDKKTIYWCVTCETALADAEVEYKDKTSHSIFVKFRISKPAPGLEKYAGNLYVVVWTTTPWTLPANMAAAVSESETYRVLKAGDSFLLVADKLADSFLGQNKLQAEKLETFSGKELVGMEYEHCLSKRLPEKMRFPRKVISTDFVDMSAGSGVVHIAPGHGEEDFHAGKKWGLEIVCPVNEEGRFTPEAGEFEGMKIFEANATILEKLASDGLLLSSGELSHSYPHCWRCKKPVVFRATQQWFLKVDAHDLRKRLLESADKVNWIPKAGKERMTSMLRLRPDWCLSRQRHWGTPILAFYCEKCDKLQGGLEILKGWQKRMEKEGSDFWFAEPLEKLLPAGYKCECGSSSFRKDKDILDVWLDSGVSWYAVVKNRLGADLYPAEIYLEGSDQHRGWFQTSLIPSVALNGIPPYKNVLTHGFVLDEHGRAMHKSVGNVVPPQDIVNKYGADPLRLWVALTDYSDDVRISDKIMAGPVDTYRKIRNTVRYLLGNLSGYDPVKNRVEYAAMTELDRYMLMKLYRLNVKVRAGYEAFEYRDAIKAINDFCILELSSFYLDALKDRLYTMSLNSPERRSAQTVLYETLKSLLVMTAPVLSFTCEEAWQVFRSEIDGRLPASVFLNDWPLAPAEWASSALEEKWEKIMVLREKAHKLMEELRKKGEIGSSVESRVVFYASGGNLDFLKENLPALAQALIVSECRVEEKKGLETIEAGAFHSDGEKCPRCWQWRKDIGSDGRYPGVCSRCAQALGELNS